VFLCDMANLPILQFEEKIVETVEKNSVVVIIGETGSGKSTQLSQILHRHGYTKSGVIAITQPRRVAAVSVARLFSVCFIMIPHLAFLLIPVR